MMLLLDIVDRGRCGLKAGDGEARGEQMGGEKAGELKWAWVWPVNLKGDAGERGVGTEGEEGGDGQMEAGRWGVLETPRLCSLSI